MRPLGIVLGVLLYAALLVAVVYGILGVVRRSRPHLITAGVLLLVFIVAVLATIL